MNTNDNNDPAKWDETEELFFVNGEHSVSLRTVDGEQIEFGPDQSCFIRLNADGQIVEARVLGVNLVDTGEPPVTIDVIGRAV